MAHILCIDLVFSQGNRVHKICQREDRHGSCPSHIKAASIPVPASPRHLARLIPCCLVRLGNGGLGPPDEIPACTQRSICRDAGLASRLDPLAFNGDKCAAAKLCLSLCSTERPLQIRNLSIFHVTQRTGPTDEILQRRPQKTSSPLASARPFALQLYVCSIGFPPAWRTTLAILRGEDSSFFAVTQQQWRACVRRMLRCKLVCRLPSSSLDPRLASGSFAVAKDEGRDRFIGDRRPLSTRESTHRASSLAVAGSWVSQRRYKTAIRDNQGLFLLVRGSILTRGETGDWSSHPPELAR